MATTFGVAAAASVLTSLLVLDQSATGVAVSAVAVGIGVVLGRQFVGS
jgi:ABC-type uncharacterized transport system permease subunit